MGDPVGKKVWFYILIKGIDERLYLSPERPFSDLLEIMRELLPNSSLYLYIPIGESLFPLPLEKPHKECGTNSETRPSCDIIPIHCGFPLIPI